MKVYTAAKTEHKCYGHGDFGKELVIEKTGAYGSGDFPPLFTSELMAESWIKEQFLPSHYQIVELEIQL